MKESVERPEDPMRSASNGKAAASASEQELAGLLSVARADSAQPDARVSSAWSQKDLAAIWQHQLEAPLLLDLCGMGEQAAATAAAHVRLASSLGCFADLLTHATPPIELLQLAKEFAKIQRLTNSGAYPVDVANVLYYASIAAAAVRLGSRITRIDDGPLRLGVQWCLQRTWIDPATRTLFEQHLAALPDRVA